jgi:rubrerythrin
MAHAEATDNPLVKEVLIDIANEERVHAGEFSRLLQILTGDEDELLAQGAEEEDEMAGKSHPKRRKSLLRKASKLLRPKDRSFQ